MSDTLAPIIDFLNRFNTALGVESAIDVELAPEGPRLNMTGEDAELLARHRGEPLKALQHVVDMTFARDLPGDQRVFIDRVAQVGHTAVLNIPGTCVEVTPQSLTVTHPMPEAEVQRIFTEKAS